MSSSAFTRTTTLVASVVAVGFSTLFMASSASAAPTCSNGATLISSNVCELRITTVGATTITPTADMSQLEVLLVAGGGNGTDSSQTYASGGGGGEVIVVGFGTDTSNPVDVVVGGAAADSTATQGALIATARAGLSGNDSGGGSSGNGNTNYVGGPAVSGTSGGGAGGNAPN